MTVYFFIFLFILFVGVFLAVGLLARLFAYYLKRASEKGETVKPQDEQSPPDAVVQSGFFNTVLILAITLGVVVLAFGTCINLVDYFFPPVAIVEAQTHAAMPSAQLSFSFIVTTAIGIFTFVKLKDKKFV